MKKRRIAFAYYLKNWSFENGDKNKLKSDGIRITTSEYEDDEHYNNIYCPNCFTNLQRTPRKKEIAKDKTFILITHKASMLSLVDRILVMEKGRLVADGPRDKVLEALKNGQIKASL